MLLLPSVTTIGVTIPRMMHIRDIMSRFQQPNTLRRERIRLLHLRREETRGQHSRLFALTITLIWTAIFSNSCLGQIRDSFDGRAGKWDWGRNDSGARFTMQERLVSGGHDGGPCQAIQFQAGSGTRAELVYKIQPTELIHEFNASVWYWAAKPGAQISVRIRFPYAIDPRTGQLATGYIAGSTYRQSNKWDRLTIAGTSMPLGSASSSSLQSKIGVQQAVLRNALGRDIDLRQPYADAVVINAYTGPGNERVRIDDLRIDNAIPARLNQRDLLQITGGVSNRKHFDSSGLTSLRAFPGNKLSLLIEYNGETLEWLKSTGFTGAIFSQVPTVEQLREASRLDFDIVAPAATSTRHDLAGLLSPVIAWNLGDALIERDLERITAQAGSLRRVPGAMRRELIGTPLEVPSRYRGTLDYITFDIPPPIRGLTAVEEQAFLAEQIQGAGNPRHIALSVASGPVTGLRRQLDGVAGSVNAAKVEDYGWHSTWLQTMRALEFAPTAIIFRSDSALDSGRAEDHQRSSVLRFVNHLVSLVGPIIAQGTPDAEVHCYEAPFRARMVRSGTASVVVATSTAGDAISPRSGDGKVLNLSIPSSQRTQQIHRVTSLGMERLQQTASERGPTVNIVSPDFAELLLISNDRNAITQLSHRIRSVASQINFERGQLVGNSLTQTQVDWHAAVNAGAVSGRKMPTAMLRNASTSLGESNQRHRAADVLNAYQLTRRADAWEVRTRSNLLQLLAGEEHPLASHPALLAPGAIQLYLERIALDERTSIQPSTHTGRWEPDQTIEDPFRDPTLWETSGWSHDRRREDLAQLQVDVVPDETYKDRTNMRMAVVPRQHSLPGGYAGTTLRARSGKIHVRASDWVRIDAEVRITSRDTRPYRGLLVYDTFGGPDLGVFIRPDSQWRTVQLLRCVTTDEPLRVTFELIGEGEVRVRDLKLYNWNPSQDRGVPFRPLALKRDIIREPTGNASR